MTHRLIALLLLATSTVGHAEKVVPGSLQDVQAQKLFEALNAVQVECPASLAGIESDVLCANTIQDAPTFRRVVDANTAHLKPVSRWASYTGKHDQQRSYLYKDGFMTLTYFQDKATSRNFIVVQYVIPHD